MQYDVAPVRLNWDGFMDNLRRAGTPDRVYYFEHGVADNVQEHIAAKFDVWRDLPADGPEGEWRRREAVHAFLGQELFRVFPPGARLEAPKKEGEWVEEVKGAITTWEEFEAYDWPDPAHADYTMLEFYDRELRDEMHVFHVVDLWDVVVGFFGFESLCYAIHENRELVDTMFEKVGGFVESVARAVCGFERYAGIYLADDLGHKTSLFMAPDTLRELVLPWHRRIAEIMHAHDKLFLFHCCGNMYALMDDYIDEVKIDAKHSFEDVILPVTEVKRRYGDRLTLLGGMDVDFLARRSPAEIQAKSREILDVCVPGGGYFFGSGNWVTAYVPPENYLAMLSVARAYDTQAASIG